MTGPASRCSSECAADPVDALRTRSAARRPPGGPGCAHRRERSSRTRSVVRRPAAPRSPTGASPSTRARRVICRWRSVMRSMMAANTGDVPARIASAAASPVRHSRPSWSARACSRSARAPRNASPVRCVAGPVPGSMCPNTATQRILGTAAPPAWGTSVEARTASSGSASRCSRPWISSPWVNSKGAMRLDPYRPSRVRRSVPSQSVARVAPPRDPITSPNSTTPVVASMCGD